MGGKLCICNYKSECVFADSCCFFVYVGKVTCWYRRMHKERKKTVHQRPRADGDNVKPMRI